MLRHVRDVMITDTSRRRAPAVPAWTRAGWLQRSEPMMDFRLKPGGHSGSKGHASFTPLTPLTSHPSLTSKYEQVTFARQGRMPARPSSPGGVAT